MSESKLKKEVIKEVIRIKKDHLSKEDYDYNLISSKLKDEYHKAKNMFPRREDPVLWYRREYIK